MDTLKFKTSIKCAGCVEAVKPHLDKIQGVKNWEVDLQASDKLLTVTADRNPEKEVLSALADAGYQGERLPE